ncbi:hypothetical protein ACS0TY_022229 [Phlomoides rotata]
MQKLSNTLTTIHAVLGDAEERQFDDRSIQNWLGQLNDTAYEIEDLLDDCNTEFAKLKGKGINFLKKVLYKLKVGRRMKEACEKLEAIKDRQNFQLKEIVAQEPEKRDWRQTLCFAYNVSDDFDLRAILKKIIESVTGERSNFEDLNSLQRHLIQVLNKKRYLLILDSVWNENEEAWDEFKYILSPLGDLPRLKYLYLSDAKALEYIVEESETPCTKFASLEALGLNDLPELKGWSKEEMVDMFPNLNSLGITSCDLSKLTPTSTCLSKLDFRNCKIESCFPERWLQKLHSLKELSVYECTELANVWAEEIKNLHRLRRLSIAYDDDLVSLPQVLQHIPSLRSLSLHGLVNLASLPDWLPNLASLTELNIEGCPVIPSLPSSIRGMTNLKRLSIKGCRLLGRRCEKVNGADWDKISHIPQLDI